MGNGDTYSPWNETEARTFCLSWSSNSGLDTAQQEDVFGSGVCSAPSSCGDGQRVGDEACDDTNTTPGDGCSATCTVEEGLSARAAAQRWQIRAAAPPST